MQKRRLAAILFSDIAGYSAIMQKNELEGIQLRKNNLKIHKINIKKYHGRLLKEMGDGILASFDSIIDAVLCSLSIQREATEANIPLRIGIHLGEVIFERKDVLGDGVNIASRIREVANPNEITISETVYNDIKNKEGLITESLGEITLKGISKPVNIYKVNYEDERLLDYRIDTGEIVKPIALGRSTILIGILVISLLIYAMYYFISGSLDQPEAEKFLLILPFENQIGSDSLDFLVAGMHDALIGNVGKIRALRVKSTTTAKAYGNVDKSIPEIALELDVNVVIEGSVMCVGDSICLRVQMVDPENENQIWVQDFYEERSQILNLYNRITREITDQINVNLRSQEESFLTEYRTVDPEAYDAYIQGKLHLDKINRKSLPLAAEFFTKAIEIDPDWAPPYAGLAEVGQYQKQMAFADQAAVLPEIYKNLYRALELDPNSANSHYIKAVIAVWSEYEWAKGEAEFLKTLELNPNDALCRVFYSHLLMILGRTEEALYQGEQAFKLDPLRPFVLGLYTAVLNWAGKYESAISIAQEALIHDPDHFFATRALAGAYFHLGKYDEWFEYWKRHFWGDDSELNVIDSLYNNQGYEAALLAIISVNEEANEKGNQIHLHGQAKRYLRVNNFERALDYLEKMYNTRDPNMPYITTNGLHHPKLKQHPRYKDLVTKLKLPLH